MDELINEGEWNREGKKGINGYSEVVKPSIKSHGTRGKEKREGEREEEEVGGSFSRPSYIESFLE